MYLLIFRRAKALRSLRKEKTLHFSTAFEAVPQSKPLAEAEDRVGDVGFFEGGDLFSCEFDCEGGYCVGEVIGLGGADDG
jgi:hypothetical protein